MATGENRVRSKREGERREIWINGVGDAVLERFGNSVGWK
jgi:hypothetical protein